MTTPTTPFRFYITNLFDGVVEGTNSEEAALQFAACEDYFVVEPAANVWLNGEERLPVRDVSAPD